ncbi:MAG TPA: efflux transporter outer membrane subunit [Verrucomicrobiae bacterium]|nr:efflux transporter outer membrane subunit [Verrucomicrobiae bacterium]
MKPATINSQSQHGHHLFCAARTASLLLGISGLALGLSGCAIGPNYKRPAIAAPAQFRGAPETNSANSLADLPWWGVFKDQTLTNLVQIALTNNYDLRLAVSRVEQSRALAMEARAQFLPQIGYDGEAARGRNSFLGSPFPMGVVSGAALPKESFLALFNASWEVDLWGRIRRLNESARAQYFASEEARRGVALSLISQVAQAYFELLELDEQLGIARRATNSFGETLEVFSNRLGAGAASELETWRAEAALATATAAAPELERQIALKEDQISILLGRNPGPIPRNKTLLQQAMPPEVPAGLPSELLERRPDLRQAEQLARSANAQVGVALGDFLPKIGLTALYGGVSMDLSAITSPGANLWSIGANVTGPLFQGGRLYGQYRQSEAAWEQAKLQYQQTALNALREVVDALITRQKLEAVRTAQERAVAAYRKAVEVSTRRYLAGKANYYEVLEAQQQLFPAENALAQTRRNQLIVIVQLYQALGGGW